MTDLAPDVPQVEKTANAHMADALNALLALRGFYGQSSAGRAVAVAITQLETAQMWADKATRLTGALGAKHPIPA